MKYHDFIIFVIGLLGCFCCFITSLSVRYLTFIGDRRKLRSINS